MPWSRALPAWRRQGLPHDTMKLYATSDLHLLHAVNRTALLQLAPHPEDWLIVAGDVGETDKLFAAGMALLARRFARDPALTGQVL